MFLIAGIIFAVAVSANAAYSSSSSAGAGAFNSNSYQGQSYSPNYPYVNNYAGYAGAGGFPNYVQDPYATQAQFQQYFNQLSAYNANLYNQQLAYQQAVFNNIRNQALGGAAAGGFAGAGAGAGSGAYAGGSTGTFGGLDNRFGGTYGGSYGGRPNYASSGGYVSSNGNRHQYANIYPANPSRPNLDSRFGGDDAGTGVYHSAGAPGVSGVSSFSSSSNVNGQTHRESATSVNNNGKVTTYHTRS